MLKFIGIFSFIAALYLLLVTITGKNYFVLLVNWVIGQTEYREIQYYRQSRVFKPSKSLWAKYRHFIKKRTEEMVEDRFLGINFIIPFTGYNTILFILGILGYTFGSLWLGKIFGIFMFIAVLIGVNLLLSIRGKERNDRYLFELLLEINYLCSDMRGGLSNAIESQKNNLNHFGDKFLKFNNRITLGGMSFEESIRLLEFDLGPASHEFLRAALNYEKKGTESTAKIFEDIIRYNGSIEEINALQRRNFANHREELNKLLVVIGIITIFLLVDADTIQVLKKWYGQIIFGSILVSIEILLSMYEVLREPLYLNRDTNETEVV